MYNIVCKMAYMQHLLSLLLLSAAAVPPPRPPLAPDAAFQCAGPCHAFDLDLATGAYSVSVDAAPWLAAGGVRVRAGGTWRSSAAGGGLLLNASATSVSNGSSPTLGVFAEAALQWLAADSGAAPVVTRFRCYGDGGALEFALDYPSGATGAATSSWPPAEASEHLNASRAPSALFPLFAADAASLLGASLGYAESAGDWGSEDSHLGVGLLNGFVGGQASGPLLLFDASAGAGSRPPAVLLSGMSNFRSTIFALADDAVFGAGQQGYLDNIPAGFSQRVLLHSSCAGPAEAAARWGDALQREYNTTRLSDADDLVSSRLSFFTDNGGYYTFGFWNSPSAPKPQQMLPELRDYHRLAGLPIAVYQLDPYWLPTGSGANGGSPEDWMPRPDFFPQGLEPLAASGMRFMLYGAYWALDSPLQTDFSFETSELMTVDFPPHIARVEAPQSRALHDELMRRGAAWGMAGMETDWIMRNTQPYTSFQTTVGLYRCHPLTATATHRP